MPSSTSTLSRPEKLPTPVKGSSMTPPTVVLVHGAFADASSWSAVIAELTAAGVDIAAPPNQLRGIPTDAAYLTSFVNQLGGPTILVGHSYGGAPITQSAADAREVLGLVYVAAFAPEADEKLADINARYPDIPLSTAQRTLTYPTGDGTSGREVFIEQGSFHDVFCADLSVERARLMALTQRPISTDGFTSVVTGTPAWHSLPSWAIVSTADHAIHPDAERDMAKRAGAEVVELDASHAAAVSRPERVADVILRAVHGTSSA
jgi:pimeloyl-ACP methyl ester carboxylesterase